MTCHPQTIPSGGALRAFRHALLSWYDENRRDLPWRNTRDPYRIWVAEIMLQQTRVGAVLQHYDKFLGRFPSIEILSRARQSSVMAFWSGLGYYHRARALHAAARLVCREYGGRLPQNCAALRRLPGIGRYTAAAIASIAFGEGCAVVDGNVERVLARMATRRLAAEESWRHAEVLVSRKRPGDFNQAIMELGATVCLPRSPQCELCPIARWCGSAGEPLTSWRPRPPKRRKKQLYYVLAVDQHGIYLVQRAPGDSLMPGMWELPGAGGPAKVPVLQLAHSITDTDYAVTVVRADHAPVEGRLIPRSRLARLPLTGLARKILRRCEIIK
jgi:A/G-specific adenine glycosylase